MNSFMRSVISAASATVLIATAPFSFAAASAPGVSTSPAAPSMISGLASGLSDLSEIVEDIEYKEQVGYADMLDFDADPDLHLAGEDDPAPEDDPSSGTGTLDGNTPSRSGDASDGDTLSQDDSQEENNDPDGDQPSSDGSSSDNDGNTSGNDGDDTNTGDKENPGEPEADGDRAETEDGSTSDSNMPAEDGNSSENDGKASGNTPAADGSEDTADDTPSGETPVPDKAPNPEDDPQSPVYDWPGVKDSNTSEVFFLVNGNGKRFEFRKLAKQKMYGYDTFQGACAYGKYSYHVLFNRKNQKCRIIKVKIATNKVVKISKPLALDHGNDMTYDSTRKRLAVIHYGAHPRRISTVDPKTLKVTSYTDIKTPTRRLPGASTKFSKSIAGVTGIGYDKEHDEYIASIKGARHYVVMDENFELKSVIKVPKNDPYMRQGMTVMNGFIIRAFSADKKPYNQNILYVYDLAGNFIKTVKLGQGYEIESIYMNGDTMYASTYTSYYKKVTKKVKRLVSVRKKNGKVVKKKKKLKVTVYSLRRDNNIIRIAEY